MGYTVAKRFNGICIITKNVTALREFYQRVLQVDAQGDDTHVRFVMDGADLAAFSESGMESMAPGSTDDAGHGSYTIEVEVDDVDRECERLRTLNVTFVKPPTTQPWGRRSVWFRDPDGNIVNFYADVAASSVGRPVPKTGDLKARAREYFSRLLNDRDLSVCDTFLSSDYADHDAPSDVQGPESFKEYVAKFLEDYPDLKLRIEDVVAESDKVVLRNTWTGQKVTGEDLHMTGIVILRFNGDGLIVERWSAYGD